MDILVGREIIFEFRSAGVSAQVCAIDCATGIEVFVITPANAMRIDQQNLALRKLAKALVDQNIIASVPPSQEHSAQQNGGNPAGSPPSSKRGFIA